MTKSSASPGWEPSTLPADGYAGSLVARAWDPVAGGPSPVSVRAGGVVDISHEFATVSELCEHQDPAAAAVEAPGPLLGSLTEIMANTFSRPRQTDRPWLLSPVDLQTLKAAGVTFARSLIERVIEERAHGDSSRASIVRDEIVEAIGAELSDIRPGSAEALRLRSQLQESGLWSQYLEVGIGPDAEIFTKAPTLASVGTGAEVGVPEWSDWNNPEPEAALVVNSSGRAVGATLANDVNLRDVEGRSALLLPQAKDNNASCALGPMIRLFDASFDLDAVRSMTVRLEIDGVDGFHLDGASALSEISRDPLDLVAHMLRSHDYPDGVVLMLGTTFAPVADRGTEGMGFTHQYGDVVRISSDELGELVNRVEESSACPPWSFGIRELMDNLSHRGLL